MEISRLKVSLLFATLLGSSIAIAYPVQSNHDAHTWHVISTKNGNWTGTLQGISEKSSFVKPDGSSLSTFTLSPTNPIKFGFVFDPKDDFDVVYTLTLAEQSTKNFVSKACVFVITAKGPANPDIRYFSYNGATCSYTVVPGVGEDFSVA